MAKQSSVPARGLMLISGFGFLLVGLVYNEWLLSAFLENSIDEVRGSIRMSQLVLIVLGGLLMGAGALAPKSPGFEAFLARSSTPKLLLLVLSLVGPLAVGELTLGPLAARTQSSGGSIFMRDEAVGWRLDPGAVAEWGGVEVGVNALGFRGPLVAREKPPAAHRVLYLGDSVTFGFGLENDLDTYPFRVEHYLESYSGGVVESLNSGVGGWSPWQQAIYLEEQGLAFRPDLVVVGFVLNDVTSKFDLVAFGGSWEGFQVSSIPTIVDKLSEASGIIHYGRRLLARLRFGSDLKAGSRRKQALDVETIVTYPEREDVVRAWDLTLVNLLKIVEICREKQIDLALVVFPFTFQFEDPAARNAPQKTLSAFAAKNDLPMLDLLPLLADEMAESGRPVESYFFDEDHMTVRGSDVVGEMVASWLVAQGLGGERP